MTTALDIVTLALKDAGALGVGQTPLDEDSNDALTLLNWMLFQWRQKRWLVYHEVTTVVTSTGAQSYSVGPGGDYNLGYRPARLQSAFLRQLIQSQPNQIDYPLEILESREDYNNIALKSLVSFPSYIFYDSGYPLGTIYPWPVPQPSIYAVAITTKDVLQSFSSLATVLSIPDEYIMAMETNLAVRLAAKYGQEPSQSLVGMARDALQTLRGANFQIARLTMPNDLVRPGIYNPYSDQVR